MGLCVRPTAGAPWREPPVTWAGDGGGGAYIQEGRGPRAHVAGETQAGVWERRSGPAQTPANTGAATLSCAR